jgi:anti-sigma regulatory factor (Ser/Thr protein kinase)
LLVQRQSRTFQKLDSVTFDQMLEDQRPFDSSDPVFDLTGVCLITPAALTELAAACYSLNEIGHEPLIIVEDLAVRSYLRRSGFVNLVQDVVRFEPEFHRYFDGLENLRGTNPLLIELTRIEAGSELPVLLHQIVWVLREKLKYRKYDAFDVATAVSEVCQNTFDHNSATCGFLAMQVYGRGANRFLEIGIADYGGGLLETLGRNPLNAHIRTERQAIEAAVRLHTSEHDDPTRGTGLYHLLDIAYRHSGAVQIRTGDAKVRYRFDKRQAWGFQVVRMEGVQVTLTLQSRN